MTLVVERKAAIKLEVFDPAMCCSTGVCGPTVDPALATFAADLEWLTSTGATVRRYNLGQEPGEFAGNEQVRALLQESGEAALPVVLTDGELRSTGRYPTRDEIITWSDPAATACCGSPEPVTSGAAPVSGRGCC